MNTNTNLVVLKDSYMSDQDASFSINVLSKYKLSFNNLKIKHKDLHQVLEKIKEIDPNLIENTFKLNTFYEYMVLESKDNFLTFDCFENKKKVAINYYFNTYSESVDIFNVILEYQDKDNELYVNISNFFMTADKQIKATELVKVHDDFTKNSEDYYPYLNIKEMFKQYLLSDNNILLLSGTAGTGKTRLGDMFMQHLLEMQEVGPSKTQYDEFAETIYEEYSGVKVAYIKNEEILSSDIFWNTLQEEEFQLVFLDDLDFSLLPRTQNINTSEDIQKNKFISNLLSFTDGIFDAGNKTKFIITSNRDVSEIDSAVLRKGRTFDILNLRELTNDEALKIWVSNGLSEEDFCKEFSGSVLQADLGSTINLKVKAIKEKVQLKPYLQEEGISVLSKIKKPKKIGL